jgi:hypothetical protein
MHADPLKMLNRQDERQNISEDLIPAMSHQVTTNAEYDKDNMDAEPELVELHKNDDEEPSSGPSTTTTTTTTTIPKELLQVEEVDMNSETMDPFEWTTRKLISIPKTYYWDTNVDPKELPFKLKVWHRSVGVMGSAVRLIDRMGKPVVGFLGLSSSRFDYVTSTMTDSDWENSRRIVEERAQLEEQEKVEDGNASSREVNT